MPYWFADRAETVITNGVSSIPKDMRNSDYRALVDSEVEIAAYPLEELRQQVLDAAKAARDAALDQGVTYNNLQWGMTEIEKINLLAIGVQALRSQLAVESGLHRGWANVTIPPSNGAPRQSFDAEQACALLDAMMARHIAVFATYWAHVAVIEGADRAALETYDSTTGYEA